MLILMMLPMQNMTEQEATLMILPPEPQNVVEETHLASQCRLQRVVGNDRGHGCNGNGNGNVSSLANDDDTGSVQSIGAVGEDSFTRLQKQQLQQLQLLQQQQQLQMWQQWQQQQQ